MSAAKMMKPAQDLKPGDVFFFCGARAVVVHSEIDEAQRVRFWFAMMGTRDYELSSTTQAPDAQFTVELPVGLTPVQARADELLGYVKEFSAHLRGEESHWGPHFAANLQDTIDELDPPKPPTLAEALSLLRKFESDRLTAEGYDKAIADMRTFLKRVPN